MKKSFLFLLFLFLSISCFSAKIIKGPFIEDTSLNTAIIKFTASEKTPAWLEYGPMGRCNQLMAISSPKYNHKFILHGLTSNTQFCYRAYVMNKDETGVQDPIDGTFRTLFTPERKIVNFLVIGNTSASNDSDTTELKATMARNMVNFDADFLIHTGNISASGTKEDEVNEFFNPYAILLKNTTLLTSIGTDEYGPNAKTKEGKGFLAGNYKSIHNMPWSKGTPNYYYIDTANARIIFIDTNYPFGILQAPQIDKKSPQYEWLKTSLATTSANKWKIIVTHNPIYSSGKSEDLLSSQLAPLFELYKVNLVIQGHQGAYERTHPIKKGKISRNGPIYITIGGSGKFFEESSYENEWTNKYFATPHFANIKIVDRKLSLRTYTYEAKLIDGLDINF